MSDKPIGLPTELSNLTSAQRYAKDTSSPTETGAMAQSQFLELMITQLNHQDPMKPMESGDFLGQLAQFSTVNGISELQKSVMQMADALQSNQALQASTLVGREAVLDSDVLTMNDAGAAQGMVEVPSTASDVTVRVLDAAGQTVREMPLGTQYAGTTEFTWDGLGDNGVQLAPGSYRFVVEGDLGDGPTALNTYTRERIESVTLARDGSAPTLNLANQSKVSLNAIREIM